jgi:hypothetical protein
MQKRNERLKSLQYLVIHPNNELFKPKIKNVYLLFSQAINNSLKFEVFLNLLTCWYDKLESIPKKPMSPTFV